MTAATFIAMDADDLADVQGRFRSHPDLHLELPAGAVLRHGMWDGTGEAMTITFPANDEAPNGVVVLIQMDGEHMDLSAEDETEA